MQKELVTKDLIYFGINFLKILFLLILISKFSKSQMFKEDINIVTKCLKAEKRSLFPSNEL
jgi:hypothetical protein